MYVESNIIILGNVCLSVHLSVYFLGLEGSMNDRILHKINIHCRICNSFKHYMDNENFDRIVFILITALGTF